MKKLLLSLLIVPVLGFGQYVFNTNDELKTAVDLYADNKTTAINQYGDINTWDVSAITDFSNLFSNNRKEWSIQDPRNYFAKFNSDISNWDVSNGSNFYGMFGGRQHLIKILETGM